MPIKNTDYNKQEQVNKKFNPKRFSQLILLEVLVVALFLIALGSPYNTKLTNMILFHPVKELYVDQEALSLFSSRYGVIVEEVQFPSQNGKQLHGWYFKKPDSKTTFLVSHGNGGNLSHRYLLFAALFEAGGSVFIYDYQGYGKSEGEVGQKAIVEDGLSAYDYLVSNLKVPANQIVGYGESLGCAVTTKILESRPLTAVILQSPFAELAQTAKDKLPWAKLYPDFMFQANSLDNLKAYQRKHAPLLLIHGEKDYILKSDYSKAIYKNALEPKDLLILPDCGHNDIYPKASADVVSKIRQFIESLPAD